MTAHALMYVDKATFFRFIEESADEQHRYEWVRGWIMQQQAGGTLKHSRIAGFLLSYLLAQLDGAKWAVTGSDFAADTGKTVRYPDLMVLRADLTDGKALSTENATVLVEVLSPTSEERDLSAKPAEYLSLASLDTYIVASQDEALCYVWQRQGDGTFTEAPEKFEGLDAVIPAGRLGVAIPLAEIYRNIF